MHILKKIYTVSHCKRLCHLPLWKSISEKHCKVQKKKKTKTKTLFAYWSEKRNYALIFKVLASIYIL